VSPEGGSFKEFRMQQKWQYNMLSIINQKYVFVFFSQVEHCQVWTNQNQISDAINHVWFIDVNGLQLHKGGGGQVFRVCGIRFCVSFFAFFCFNIIHLSVWLFFSDKDVQLDNYLDVTILIHLVNHNLSLHKHTDHLPQHQEQDHS
jgi:hypothetical protein